MTSESEEDFDIFEDGESLHGAISRGSVGSRTIHACPYAECSKFFNRPNRLAIHLRSHTGEKPFKCPISDCMKSYARKEHLNRHVENSHQREKQETPKEAVKNLLCQDCQSPFSNKHSLKKHWKTYHQDAPKPSFKCSECDQVFVQRKKLKMHRSESHPELERPHKCQQCPKRFLYPKQLRIHEKIHQGHKCDLCDKTFEKWSLLRTHKARDHLKSLKCQACSKELPSQRALKSHLSNEHSEERSVFVCPKKMCNRLYFYEKNLQHHIKTYHDGKRLPCTFEGCHEKFVSRGTRKRHLKLAHTGEKKPPKQKCNKPRKPRHDKGISKSSIAAELCGLEVDEELSQRMVKNSGKVSLSTETLAKEIQECSVLLPSSSDEQSQEETENGNSEKGLANQRFMPDVLIPMRKRRLSSSSSEDELSDLNENEVKQKEPTSKSFDFSQFLSKKSTKL